MKDGDKVDKRKMMCAILISSLICCGFNHSAVLASTQTPPSVNEVYQEVLPVSPTEAAKKNAVSDSDLFHEVLPVTPPADDKVSDNQTISPTEEVNTIGETVSGVVSDNSVSSNNIVDSSVSENSVSSSAVPIEEVSANEVQEDAVSENAVSENTVSENTVSENAVSDNIIRVLLPVKLDFAINPYGFGGMGQVISNDYDMINYSNVPIEVEIADIYYEFADPENCVSLHEPGIGEDVSEKKAFYLYLSRADIVKKDDEFKKYYKEYIDGQDEEWGQQTLAEDISAGENDILITDEHLIEPIKFVLAPSIYEEGELVQTDAESMATFRFFGSMSSAPKVDWFSDNMKLKIVYTYRVVED